MDGAREKWLVGFLRFPSPRGFLTFSFVSWVSHVFLRLVGFLRFPSRQKKGRRRLQDGGNTMGRGRQHDGDNINGAVKIDGKGSGKEKKTKLNQTDPTQTQPKNRTTIHFFGDFVFSSFFVLLWDANARGERKKRKKGGSLLIILLPDGRQRCDLRPLLLLLLCTSS
jgi:hypothetical protein